MSINIESHIKVAIQQGAMTDERALAYAIYFESLEWDDELIQQSILRISEKEWHFSEMANIIRSTQKSQEDAKKVNDLRNQLTKINR